MRTLEHLTENAKQMHRAYTRIGSMMEALKTLPDLHEAAKQTIELRLESWTEIRGVSVIRPTNYFAVID